MQLYLVLTATSSLLSKTINNAYLEHLDKVRIIV